MSFISGKEGYLRYGGYVFCEYDCYEEWKELYNEEFEICTENGRHEELIGGEKCPNCEYRKPK